MPKFKRNAKAHWEGTVKEGKGKITTESGVLNEQPYSFKIRFEGEPGTNPEELIGAAHAGCYTMQLSAFITEEGFTPNALDTSADVHFEDGAITRVTLKVTGDIEGMEEDKFVTLAEKAKKECPISKSLNPNIDIQLEASLK